MNSRINLISVFILLHGVAFSQFSVSGLVVDEETATPLSFCNIQIEGSGKGAITNADGIFIISVDLSHDVLIFSYLGYEVNKVSASTLKSKPTIALKKKTLTLPVVDIISDKAFIYSIISKCRNNLLKDNSYKIAKAYYRMGTESKLLSTQYYQGQGFTLNDSSHNETEPVELLECFYNAYLKGINLSELKFKNGRTVIDASGNYFFTLNTSIAISRINLVQRNVYFPAIPLQFSEKKMLKLFEIENYYADDIYYNIHFIARNQNKNCFSGELWIDKKSFQLVKVNLVATNTLIHPFLPIFPSDSISGVNFNITYTNRIEGNVSIPDHINFKYSFLYHSKRDSSVATIKNIKREISSNGLMYFYDYNNPFILPYFKYNDSLNDYYKISFIPHSTELWEENSILTNTEKEKESFMVLKSKGDLINYDEDYYTNRFMSNITDMNQQRLFNFFYAFWTPEKRVIPNKASPQFKTYNKVDINSTIKSELYNLKVQILLDINNSHEILKCKSFTVFDNAESFFHLPTDSVTNAFINIYFDICEIERRKMQEKLNSGLFSLSMIDSIYQEAELNRKRITNRYLKEVDIGMNTPALISWNKYVVDIFR